MLYWYWSGPLTTRLPILQRTCKDTFFEEQLVMGARVNASETGLTLHMRMCLASGTALSSVHMVGCLPQASAHISDEYACTSELWAIEAGFVDLSH